MKKPSVFHSSRFVLAVFDRWRRGEGLPGKQAKEKLSKFRKLQ